MKIIYKFQTVLLILILTLSPFVFTSCSSDEDNDTPDLDVQEQEQEIGQEEMEEEGIDFEAVTIDLTMADFAFDDIEFTVQGFNFRNFRGAPCADQGCFPGIGIFGSDDEGNSSYIELDLTNITGVSRISPRIAQSTETPITFFNGDEIVAEIMAVSSTVEESFMDNPYDLNGQEVTAVRITSLEAIVQSITLE